MVRTPKTDSLRQRVSRKLKSNRLKEPVEKDWLFALVVLDAFSEIAAQQHARLREAASGPQNLLHNAYLEGQLAYWEHCRAAYEWAKQIVVAMEN